MLWFGGSGESWTRVRKDIHEAFSERRSSTNFICPLLKIKDKNRLASNTIHGYLAITGKFPAYFDTCKRATGKSLEARGLNYAAIAKLLLFLAFIFKTATFNVDLATTARLPGFNLPVETISPPYLCIYFSTKQSKLQMFCWNEWREKMDENAEITIWLCMEHLQKNLHSLRIFDIIRITDHIRWKQ